MVNQYLTLCTSTRAQYNFGMRLTFFHTPALADTRVHARLGDAETTRHTTNQMKLCPR